MGYVTGAVYILADEYNDKIYVGVTSQLSERVLQHRSGTRNGYANWNRIYKLVYFEYFKDIGDAITREKQLKHSLRQYKNMLIERFNPDWTDLFGTLDGVAINFPYQYDELT